MSNKLNKEFYNTILAQAFSPCGRYLVTGDIYGNLSIFKLSKVVNPEAQFTKDELIPKSKITVKSSYQINSLLSLPDYLLVGGYGEIYAYSWKNLKSFTISSNYPSWTIEIPNIKEELNRAEVNSLAIRSDLNDQYIYAGCGDNNIYVFDLETRKSLKTLTGHSDYIHCIRTKTNNDLLSGGEDGIVNIWDLRTYNITGKIEPHLDEQMQRKELGKWIGAIDYNEDYILCGGGPRLSLIHYRFLTPTLTFPIDDGGIHVAEIENDKIFAGGKSSLFYQMNFNGNIISEIPISGATTYSMIKQDKPFRVMCIAGSSAKIDISINYMYKHQQLSMY